MFIHWKFVYKPENFPKFQSFFFFKNTPKYDKLSKISNISIKTMLELRTKFGNFGNFGHISDGLRKQYSVRTQCCNLIGSEPLYIPCIEVGQMLLADLGGGRQGRPLGVQILSFSCSFRQKNLKSNSTFGSWRTPSGKSWIRHCLHFGLPCSKFSFTPYDQTFRSFK